MAHFQIEVPGNWTIGATCVTRDDNVGREVCVEIERSDPDTRTVLHMYLSPPAVENLRRILGEANAIAVAGGHRVDAPGAADAERDNERAELLIQARKLRALSSRAEFNDLMSDEDAEFLHDLGAALVEHFSKGEG